MVADISAVSALGFRTPWLLAFGRPPAERYDPRALDDPIEWRDAFHARRPAVGNDASPQDLRLSDPIGVR